jgi:hypothetical protein
MDAELDAEPCLADLNDDLLRNIASRLAESDLASAVALKRCSSRFKDLATPLVANAVSRINTKWRDAADKIGMEGAARIRGGLERNEVLTTLELGGNYIRAEHLVIFGSKSSRFHNVRSYVHPRRPARCQRLPYL